MTWMRSDRRWRLVVIVGALAAANGCSSASGPATGNASSRFSACPLASESGPPIANASCAGEALGSACTYGSGGDAVNCYCASTDGAGGQEWTCASSTQAQCHSTADCGNGGEVCAWPGVSLGCPGGGCSVRLADGSTAYPSCSSDSDCADAGAGFICGGPFACDCHVAPYCVAGCTSDSQCGPGQVCSALRCTGAPCQRDGDCITNFVCGIEGTCARKACAADSDCKGYCLGGSCYEAPGFCGSLLE